MRAYVRILRKRKCKMKRKSALKHRINKRNITANDTRCAANENVAFDYFWFENFDGYSPPVGGTVRLDPSRFFLSGRDYQSIYVVAFLFSFSLSNRAPLSMTNVRYHLASGTLWETVDRGVTEYLSRWTQKEQERSMQEMYHK